MGNEVYFMKKILIIDDNEKFVEYFVSLFADEDDIVTEYAYNTHQIVDNYKEGLYDLIVTDLMLPEMKGNYVVHIIKNLNPKQKIVILTSHPSQNELISGFKAGADEFFSKDVPREVLKKRIMNLLMIPNKMEQFIISERHNLTLDLFNRLVIKDDSKIKLTAKEFDLLRFLLEHKNETLTRERILNSIWGERIMDTSETRTIDAHVKNLREKLNLSCIMSIRGLGYRWYE
jgi:DNA-binding response OmpR family regulator